VEWNFKFNLKNLEILDLGTPVAKSFFCFSYHCGCIELEKFQKLVIRHIFIYDSLKRRKTSYFVHIMLISFSGEFFPYFLNSIKISIKLRKNMWATLQLFGVLEAKWAQNGSKKKIAFQKHVLDINFKLSKNRLNCSG
jgi:hypothetical protein